MTGTAERIARTALRADWSQLEMRAALRCTAGAAVPLVAAIATGRRPLGVFAAIGAVSVGFGSFQGTYRSRAAIMLLASAGMACSMFAGTVAGHAPAASALTATLWAFASGLFVALGPAAGFVALQSAVAVILASAYPGGVAVALGRALLVFAGGLVQIVLVVMLWPLRRFTAERRIVAAVYRSLAEYAANVPRGEAVAPEPHTLAGAPGVLSDPHPLATRTELLVFRALLDEAERIRASLAALAALRLYSTETMELPVIDAMAARTAALLSEIAASVDAARMPAPAAPVWRAVEEAGRSLTDARALADALLGQLRAAWRTAAAPSDADAVAAAPRHVRPLRRTPPFRDAINTLGANMTLESTTFRHALRLAAGVAIAMIAAHALSLPRGYWIALTVLLVLKPEFHETFARGMARVAGTLAGAGLATLITAIGSPGPVALTVLVLACVWGSYATFRINYAVFTACITGYVVFLLGLAGVPESAAAEYRALDTIIGGALALVIYGIWPTWLGDQTRDLLARLLEAHARYTAALLAAYADSSRLDLAALDRLRAAGRLARSNADAAVERLSMEPAARQSIAPVVAAGVLAAARRLALASLSLHAGLEPRPALSEVEGSAPSIPEAAPLANAVVRALEAFAASLRDRTPPPGVPGLRDRQLALASAAPGPVADDTDMMVDAINTIASLLAPRVTGSAAPPS